jgi:catechol 2,3-dioxygenase-like lactoylglutathione lyase family enzyme
MVGQTRRTDGTEAAVAFYTGTLGARLRWRFQRFGADVAAVELAAGPLLLLADHRPAGTILPIWSVSSLADAVRLLDAARWTHTGALGTPEGDALAFTDPDGNELALLEVVRPDALDGAWRDETNDHRVRP